MSTTEKVSINESIRATEVRAIGAEGENLGVISIKEALAKAKEAGLDLIEISPNAVPPVVRITDYGKFKYELQKKNRETKSKAHLTETKAAQVKIGTGENDMKIKASRIVEWLQDGHRVKIDLFLWGRYKYMEFAFLKERLERFLAIIGEPFTIADEIKKSPKGLTVVIEKARPGVKVWTMPIRTKAASSKAEVVPEFEEEPETTETDEIAPETQENHDN
jgi:translation initiation factor IF-3